MDEEQLVIWRQTREQVVPQIAGHDALAADVGVHRPALVDSRRERDSGEVEPGRPPFSPVYQQLDVMFLEVQARRVDEGLRLRSVEPKVLRPDLEQLALHAQLTPAQVRCPTPDDRQLRALGQVPQDDVDDFRRRR